MQKLIALKETFVMKNQLLKQFVLKLSFEEHLLMFILNVMTITTVQPEV
jgi:hypothetical protein